jgi:hypothetical protein
LQSFLNMILFKSLLKLKPNFIYIYLLFKLKKMKNIFYIVFLLTLLVSCKTAKLPGPEKKIFFGTGGGFTGKVSKYCLSSYGQLSKINMNGDIETVYQLKFKKKQLQNLFDSASIVQNAYLGFSNPGNIYYFLIINGEFNTLPSFMWGQESFKTPLIITSYYDKLNALVPQK